MNAVDWLLIVVVVVSSLLGAVRGFVRETIALLAWLIGLWAAWKYAHVVEPYLGGVLAEPGVRVWVARLIVLFAILLIASLVGLVLSYFTRHTPFGTMDRSFGGLFGLARGLVIVGLAVIAGQLLKLDTELWWRESALMPVAQLFADWIRQLVQDIEPAVRGAI